MYAFQINRPKVKNAKQAKLILDDYVWKDFKLIVDDDGTLQIGSLDGDHDECWPYALRKSEAPGRQDFPDEDKWDDAMFAAFDNGGAAGFDQVLRELAPLLESPLTLLGLTVGREGDFASVWTVQPGGAVEGLFAELE